jgi:hypothetical protein
MNNTPAAGASTAGNAPKTKATKAPTPAAAAHKATVAKPRRKRASASQGTRNSTGVDQDSARVQAGSTRCAADSGSGSNAQPDDRGDRLASPYDPGSTDRPAQEGLCNRQRQARGRAHLSGGGTTMSEMLEGDIAALPKLGRSEALRIGCKTSAYRNVVAGDPNGNRTRVFAVKGRRPRPLDDGAARER